MSFQEVPSSSSPLPPSTSYDGESGANLSQWEPDCLDKCLRCGPGSPNNKTLSGFLLLRIILAVVLTHSGVVYAGVLTYQAIKLTGCLEEDDDSSDSCQNRDTDDYSESTGDCRRLWGLIKPDSLLTVIATGAAIVLALTSIFVGTLMDITPHRRQIGLFFVVMCIVGDIFCLSIVRNTAESLAVSAGGLFITYVFKNYHYLTIESYAPELSDNHDEVSRALSVGGTWLFASEVFTIFLWIIVSFFGLSDATYGFVVTLGTIAIVGVLAIACFSRLTNTPARSIEADSAPTSLFWYSISRQKAIFLDLRNNYPDLGLYYLANSIFDPALLALFVAAIQVLVSKYKFTSDEIPIILGVAITSSIFGAAAPRLIIAFFRKHRMSEKDSEERCAAVDAVQPTVYKYLLMIDLVLIAVITFCATFFLEPCNLGLACVFGVMWGCCLAFAWTVGNIMRSALIPGGCESEFAGILMTSTSATSWIPLFVFSIANEFWTLEGGMLTLIGFYLLGAFVLYFSDVQQAKLARNATLSKRRYVFNCETNVNNLAEAEVVEENTINPL